MIKVFNKIFYVLKLLLLVLSFVSCLYIIVYMNKRLEKSLMQTIYVFVPYIIIFVLFCVNMIGRQKSVNDNIFYNITCCLVFGLIIFVGYRAIFDVNMVANIKLGYNINFNYYADMVSPINIMLFALSISNVLLMFYRGPKKVEAVNNQPIKA